MLGGLLPDGEARDVVRGETGRRGEADEGLVVLRVEYLGEGVARESVESGGEEGVCGYLIGKDDDVLFQRIDKVRYAYDV